MAQGATDPVPLDVAALTQRILDELGATGDRRLAQQLLESALGLLGDRADALDLKIAAAAMTEMREAFAVFAPLRDIQKATIFGSAPNSRCQSPCASTATRSWPGRPSSCRNPRPGAGSTLSIWKKSGETMAPRMTSGCSRPVRLKRSRR